ncbi:MaoC family dehydratase [Chloroflexota bacterium]
MPNTVTFENLQIGQEVPSVSIHVTEEKIWKFADISKDYNPLHINREWVRGYQFGKTRLEGVIAHGLFTYALMTRAMTEWVWPLGGLHHRLEARFDSPVYPGDTIRTEATVTEKKVVGGGVKYVVVDIVVKNQTGAIVAKGKAMESLL